MEDKTTWEWVVAALGGFIVAVAGAIKILISRQKQDQLSTSDRLLLSRLQSDLRRLDTSVGALSKQGERIAHVESQLTALAVDISRLYRKNGGVR